MKTSDIKNLGNAYRSIYEVKTKEEVSDNKDFKPHMMYDPETGKGYKAEKPEDHERMSKMGYTHEEPDMVKEKKLPRQMLDPKKDVMVVKNNKVLVVDKSKEKEYLKKGWGLAEQIEEEKDKKNEGKKRFKRHDGIGKAKYTISYHDGKKKHKDGSDFFDIKIFKNEKDLSDFVGTLAKQGYKLTRESVIEEAKVLDNMSQLPYPDIERPLKSMQQVKKDADLGRMEITHIVKNKQGNKVVAAVVSNGKKNFVYVNNKGVAPLAEQVDDIDERMKFGKRLKVGDIVYTADGGKYIKGEITKIIGKHDRDSGTFEVKLKSGKVVKRNLDQMAADADTMEAVSPEQQAAIAISKKEKEKEEMKNEGVLGAIGGAMLGAPLGLGGAIAGGIGGSAAQDILKKKANEGSVKDLAIKIDRVVAKMNKDSKLKPFAKKFASMAMDTMDIEKSLEKTLPSSVSGAVMIGLLEKKLDPVDDKANDKEFKNRKDKDIDNDGDVDSSDEYLHNRRAKVDDAIDGGKKPAKKEEKEDEVLKKKDKPVAKDMSQPVAKSPKTSEIEKIGESFVAMLEAALKSDGKDKDGEELSKKATDDEKIDEKEPVKGKEFIKKHDASDEDIEDKEKESVEVTTKAGSDATKPKSGKRDIDNTIGDTKIVNPVKESVNKGYMNENPFAMISKIKKVADTVGDVKSMMTGEDNNKELTSLVDQARKLLSGETEAQKSVELDEPKKEKNPYDGRMKLAKEFMQRMDKRRGK
jgi:hypothetical protein